MDYPYGKNAITEKSGKSFAWQRLFVLVVVFFFLDARNAWALQSHGDGLEGIIVHQFAHLHYIIALCILLWDLYRPNFVARPWLLLRCFCLLMVLWNCLTFIGHFAQSGIITEEGYLPGFLSLPLPFNRWIYYAATLDHLLCAPALLCLFLAMRRFYLDSLNIRREAQP